MHHQKNIQALELMNQFLLLKEKEIISTLNLEIQERCILILQDRKDSLKKTFKKITLDPDCMNPIPEYRRMESISFPTLKEVDVDLSHTI